MEPRDLPDLSLEQDARHRSALDRECPPAAPTSVRSTGLGSLVPTFPYHRRPRSRVVVVPGDPGQIPPAPVCEPARVRSSRCTFEKGYEVTTLFFCQGSFERRDPPTSVSGGASRHVVPARVRTYGPAEIRSDFLPRSCRAVDFSIWPMEDPRVCLEDRRDEMANSERSCGRLSQRLFHPRCWREISHRLEFRGGSPHVGMVVRFIRAP
jgi:hypothetical protein